MLSLRNNGIRLFSFHKNLEKGGIDMSIGVIVSWGMP